MGMLTDMRNARTERRELLAGPHCTVCGHVAAHDDAGLCVTSFDAGFGDELDCVCLDASHAARLTSQRFFDRR